MTELNPARGSDLARRVEHRAAETLHEGQQDQEEDTEFEPAGVALVGA